MGENAKKKAADRSIDIFTFDQSDRVQIEYQSINSFYAIAQESFLNKSYRIAVIYLRKILQIDNGYLPAYKLLSKIFQLRGQLKRSAEILRQAIDINFRDAELHYNLGYIYYLQGNKTGFARECTKALVVNPAYSKAFYALALLHFENARYKKTVEELEKCLTLNPNDSEAYMLRARVYIRQKKYAAAKADIENVLRFDPENERALYYLGEISFLLKDYLTAMTFYLRSNRQTSRSRQRLLEVFDLVKKELEEKIKADPAAVQPLLDLASLYYQVGQLQNAKETLAVLMKRTPNYLPAKINYGLLLVYENKFLEAIKIYQEVLRASPINEEATKNMEKALQLAESNLLGRLNDPAKSAELLDIYMLTEKYDKAVLLMLQTASPQYARQILQLVSQKSNDLYRVYQGMVLFLLGEEKEAEYLLLALLEKQYKIPALFYLLALIEKKKNKLVEAYRYFEKVKQIDPAYWLVDKEMLEITTKEIGLIKKELENRPDDQELILEYISLLSMTREYKKAIEYIIKLKQRGVESPEIYNKMEHLLTIYEKELEGKLEYENPDPEIYLELGKVYIGKKRYNEAFLLLQSALTQWAGDDRLVELYNKIVKQNIDVYEELLKEKRTPLICYNLAVLYAVSGNKKNSFELLAEAVAQDKRMAIQSRYEEAFKKYRGDDKFRLITLIEGEDKNIYRLQD